MMDRLAVVVDGSNVIHANLGSKKYFSVNRVKNVIEKLKKLGYTYQIGMKGGTYNYIMKSATEEEISEADKLELQKLIENLEVSLLNSSKDDRWIHLAAIEFDAYILSHDQYRDEIKQWEEEGRTEIAEEVNKRRIELEFFGDKPIFNLPDISEMAIVVDEEGKAVAIKEPIIEESDDVEEEEDIAIESNDYEHALITADTNLLKSLIRVGGEDSDWIEFELPLETLLGRTFFAELLGVTEATTKILKKISREHLSINIPGTMSGEKSSTKLLIKDLNSTNGTQIDGARLGKIGHVTNMAFGNTGQTEHPPWPSILLGSRLVEIKLGAIQLDSSFACFDECSCFD